MKCLVCIAERAREVPAITVCRVCSFAGCAEHAGELACARCFTPWDADYRVVEHLRALIAGYAAVPTFKGAAEPQGLRDLVNAAYANPLIDTAQIRAARTLGRHRALRGVGVPA